MLGEGIKLTWLEHLELDLGPEGAFIGAGQLGQRIGRCRESVERDRRELVRLGLLSTGARLNGRTATYFAVLPADCIPSTARPSVGVVADLAERLDAHIRRVRSGISSEVTGVNGVEGPHGVSRDAANALPAENRAQTGVNDVEGPDPSSYAVYAGPACSTQPPRPENRAQTGVNDVEGDDYGRSTTPTSPPPRGGRNSNLRGWRARPDGRGEAGETATAGVPNGEPEKLAAVMEKFKAKRVLPGGGEAP